jgi:hypothetical protein
VRAEMSAAMVSERDAMAARAAKNKTRASI